MLDYVLGILPNMIEGLGVSAQIFIIVYVLSLPCGILLSLVRLSGWDCSAVLQNSTSTSCAAHRSCFRFCSSTTGCP